MFGLNVDDHFTLQLSVVITICFIISYFIFFNTLQSFIVHLAHMHNTLFTTINHIPWVAWPQ